MNGLQEINILNRRAAENAEAERILATHGFTKTADGYTRSFSIPKGDGVTEEQ